MQAATSFYASFTARVQLLGEADTIVVLVIVTVSATPGAVHVATIHIAAAIAAAAASGGLLGLGVVCPAVLLHVSLSLAPNCSVRNTFK
jgi:hypothetical protein